MQAGVEARLAADEQSADPEQIVQLSGQVGELTKQKVAGIQTSDTAGVLEETFPLRTAGAPRGTYQDEDGNTVSFAITPGYETYRGLGWYGCIVQKPRRPQAKAD